MKKKIFDEVDLQSNMTIIKSVINENVRNAKIKNKKKCLELLLNSF